jgi:hypothetical protein
MRSISVMALATVIGACAAPQQPQTAAAASRDCFNVSLVTGYETVGPDTIRLDAGVSAKYDVDISGGQCRNVDWTHRLAIESTPSSWVCVGSQPGQGNIRFRDPTTQRVVSCYIRDVRRAHTPGS